MTNADIIETACMMAGITEEVDTFAGWKRRGYSVKKGEKSVFTTKIWKPSKFKVKDEDTDEEKSENRMILVNASFFTENQVEKVGGKEK